MGTRVHDEDEDFAGFVQATTDEMHRYAYVLTGDWHLAEDLVQIAYARVYSHWKKINAAGRKAYTRRVLLRCLIDYKRRGSSTEVVRAEAIDTAVTVDAMSEVDVWQDLRSVLLRLPPGVRAVLFCRFVEDLDVRATARLLGISVGTVKSQTTKGVHSLREIVRVSDDALEVS